MLEIQGIHTYYGGIHALKGVSLRVEEREIVCLIGANGAGKTTTLMTLSGVIQAKQGSIRFLGKDITRLAPEKIVAMGITQIPEGRMIFPSSRCGKTCFWGHICGPARRTCKKRRIGYFHFFPSSGSDGNNRAAPCPAASSRCWPSAGPSWPSRSCWCWTSHPWGSPPSWWKIFSRWLPGSTQREPPYCWWSKTPRWRWKFPTGATSCPRARSRWKGAAGTSGEPLGARRLSWLGVTLQL